MIPAGTIRQVKTARQTTAMSPPRRRHKAARLPSLTSSISTALSAIALAASPVTAFDFDEAPAANLDFSRLGKVGIAGDFTGISLYEYEGQNESTLSSNGSESLLAQLPNGAFASLAASDASIQSMCTYTRSNGDVAGVIIAGNFTSLDREKAQSVALFNPDTREITPLDGLEGQVNTVFCDKDTDKVYLGGAFKAEDSSNAVAWNLDDDWVDLPFAGFNGPVSSITRASNGHIIFGGDFTGLGNTSSDALQEEQIINLSDADISAGSSSSSAGFSDPKNIVCTGDGADGAGNTWLLADNTPGFWEASFGFEFHPSKLRLRNTRQDGRGTKTWRFTVLPDTGILNFTYTDPKSGEDRSCTNQCPLSDDPDVEFQDFHFVNSIGMNKFRIDISEFYGSGGGLSGIELFGDDIYSYAINNFNEPTCNNQPVTASAKPTGPWEETRSADTSSRYLTARLSAPITEDSASVVFLPNIKESGNYSVNMYTPGCIGDGTCANRGQINITGTMSSRDDQITFSTSLFQTNNFDKYDQIYFGYIDASSSSFQPSITITPLAGQSLDEMAFVAQRVGFSLINSSGGLRGLFDYDPKVDKIDPSKLSDSAINQLGSDFSSDSKVISVLSSDDVLYVGGEYSSDDGDNIVSINTENERISSLDGGLNGPVVSLHLDDSKLYVGGGFSKARGRDVKGLNNVAVYDTKDESWSALGAGVNGHIHYVTPLKVKLGDDEKTGIAFSGHFTECLEFDDNPSSEVSGIAVWIPSEKNWLQNLDEDAPSYSGVLSASILDLDDEQYLYAGSVSASQVGANGAATLTDGKLGRFPTKIRSEKSDSESSNVDRRELITSSDGKSGVLAGAFYDEDDKDFTVLAGRFVAELSDGSTVNNLVIIDGKDDDKVIGLDSDVADNSTFAAVAIQDNILYAGGLVSGNVDGDRVGGIMAYNLDSRSFPEQPPPLSGGGGSVSAILAQPEEKNIFVAGSFTQAGSLPCPGVCIYDGEQKSWSQPGVNIEGEVQSMIWTSDTMLAVGGTLNVNGSTDTPLATYNTKTQAWDAYPGSDEIPGPVEALTLGSSDGKQIWVAGHAEDDSVFIMKYDGSKWLTAPDDVLPESVIRSMQVFSLTEKHDSTDMLPELQSIVLVGSIALKDLGSASAVVFDGKSFQPYALTSGTEDSPGSIAQFFTQKQDFFTTGGGDMPLGFVVLIGLAISLGLMLIIVAAGVVHDRLQKKREGYVPAPTSMVDRSSGIRRVPPDQLFESLGRQRPDVPQV